MTRDVETIRRKLAALAMSFWPVGVLILESKGWSQQCVRKKRHWWTAPWMTAPTGGTYRYHDAVQMYKYDKET